MKTLLAAMDEGAVIQATGDGFKLLGRIIDEDQVAEALKLGFITPTRHPCKRLTGRLVLTSMGRRALKIGFPK